MATKDLRLQGEGLPGWMTSPPFWGLVAVAASLFAVSLNTYYEVQKISKTVNAQIQSWERRRDEEANRRAVLSRRLEQAQASNAQFRDDLAAFTNQLKLIQGQLESTRQNSQDVRVDLSQKLTALDTSVRTELATKAATDDVKEVDTKIASVKTDLDATRDSLSMARSELGTLIARNHDEIDQLRRLGERDYIEFTIRVSDRRTRVGAIFLQLRSVDPKRNRFTVDLYVDDKLITKKDRSRGEPVNFYAVGMRSPFELVVTQVSKEGISGYLSMPKIGATPASPPGG